MEIIQHLMLLLLFCCTGFATDYINQPLSWDEAEACCRSRGLQLPYVLNSGDVKVISELANATDMVSVWVSMRKKRLPSWAWVDGTKGGTNDLIGAKFGDCAVYTPKTRQIEAATCRNETGGVLCEIEDCDDCKCGKWLPTCVLHNNKSYVYLCQDITWHQARAYCAKEGWRLAVFDGSKIEGSPREVYCKSFWIGLRRKDWMSTNDRYFPNGEEVYTLWDHNEPKESGQCSALTRTTSGWNLRVKSCDLKINLLCIALNGNGQSHGHSSLTVIAGLVGGIGAVAFSAVFCIIFLVCRYKAI